MAYFINPSHQPVSLNIFAMQRLGKIITAAKNTHASIEELLGVSFYMRSLSYQRKAGDSSSQNFLQLCWTCCSAVSTTKSLAEV
jgi:hypothetical protein